MMKSFLVAASCGLFLSTSALAVGWSCTDQTGRYWQFTATGFNNGVATGTHSGNFGMTGNYAEFVSKQHWTMNVGGAGYNCNSNDGGSGSRFYCNLTYGNGFDLSMANCNAIFFLTDDLPETEG